MYEHSRGVKAREAACRAQAVHEFVLRTQEMVAVEIRFVKSSPSSITLDLHVPAHIEHEKQLRIDKFELQWREARAGSDEWATASSSLKLRRLPDALCSSVRASRALQANEQPSRLLSYRLHGTCRPRKTVIHTVIGMRNRCAHTRGCECVKY